MFKLGERVKLNEEGSLRVRWERIKVRHGTFVRQYPHKLCGVLWDTCNVIDKWDESYLERIEAMND